VNKAKKLMKRLPVSLQQGFKFVYGALPSRISYGKVFWDTYKFLLESQWWSRERLQEYQFDQLERLLDHAYRNVPYYRRIFQEMGLKPSNIKDFQDLKKFPCLDKNTFRLEANNITAKDMPHQDLILSHTSGTSGKALQFYQDYNEGMREWAFVCHQWGRAGYKPGDARVELRGLIDRKNPVHYDYKNRVLRLSPLVEDKETAQFYLKKIESFGAKFLHGYPGAIAAFARLIRSYNLKVNIKLLSVFFASEAVYDWERALCEEVFNCRVFDFYGQAEHVVMAAECEYDRNYHCVPQYGITEVDPINHEIIGTGFLNYINPFIRYRTTDIASVAMSNKCEKCNRAYYPILDKIEGRIGDFIVSTGGGLISPAAITHPFKDLKAIKETEIIQTTRDCIIVRAVPLSKEDLSYFERELKELCQNLNKIIGEKMKVKGEMVEEIKRPESGKFRWIKSELYEN